MHFIVVVGVVKRTLAADIVASHSDEVPRFRQSEVVHALNHLDTCLQV